jgi:lysophospholipase L1-like esterase
VVAIGDSDADGSGDATGRGWVGRYGDLVHSRLGVDVNVDNRAREGLTSAQLRGDLAGGDKSLEQAIAGADIVLIGIGGADLNDGDSALQAGQCEGLACYRPVMKKFDHNLSAIVENVRQLNPTALLRAITLPNPYPGAERIVPPFVTAEISHYEGITQRDIICRVMEENVGRCADALRAFNGKNGSRNAYETGLMTKDPCCYPSGSGQQRMALLVLRTGLGHLS